MITINKHSSKLKDWSVSKCQTHHIQTVSSYNENKLMKKIFLVFAVVLTMCCKLFSQESIDGIGLVTPTLVIVDWDYTGMQFEDLKSFKIDLYDGNEVKPSHFLKADTILSNLSIQYNIYDQKGYKESLDLSLSSFFWHGIKSYSLQFYRVKGGLFQVKLNNKYYWIKQDDLKKNGYEGLTWEEYFKNVNSGIIVRYNMNLRTSASTNSSKVSILKKNAEDADYPFHVIDIKGRFEGNWAEVEVKIWSTNETYCNSEKPIKKLNGWIKYIDDKGYPNIIDNAACLPQ